MGGGVFQFCSAVTEKPAVPMHQMTYSFAGIQPSSALQWPVLLMANSVIACFFAALAVGYAFFLSWDKHIIGIFAKETSKDQLLTNNTYDSIDSSRTELCERCKNNDCGSYPSNRYTVVRPQQCCHMDYCCTNPTSSCKVYGSSQGSSSGSSVGCNYSEYSHRKTQAYNIAPNCNRCILEHRCRYSDENTFKIQCSQGIRNTPDVTHSDRNEDTTNGGNLRFENASGENKNGNLHKTFDGNSFSHHHYLFNSNQSSASKFYTQENENLHQLQHKYSLGVCNDTFCKKEGIRCQRSFPLGRYHEHRHERSQSAEPAPLPNVTRSQHRSHCNPNRNFQHDVDRRNDFELVKRTENLNPRKSFENSEHLYSNFYLEKQESENVADRNLATNERDRRRNIQNFIHRQELPLAGCNCCTNQSNSFVPPKVHSYAFPTYKEDLSSSYELNQDKIIGDRGNFSQNFPSYSYSTLPARFSMRDNLPHNVSRYNLAGKREFKSCININEESQDSVQNLGGTFSNYNSWRNASVPSLKGKLDEEFENRKVVKTVKFITPDEVADYYESKPSRSSIKKSRRDYAAPDGSSENSEAYDCSSPIYR